MADYLPGRETRTQGEIAERVFVGGNEAEFIFGKGTQIFPNLPVPIYGNHATRVVLDSNERWFEFGFTIDCQLSGNAAAGWTDAGNYFRLDTQWSADLIDWSMGKFVPAPVPVLDNGNGTWTYWSRAIHPVDSAIKTGMLQASSGSAYYNTPGNLSNGDARNNPFTALTILGVSRALGGFPYTMPGDAARMQTDLAAIFPGATVEAASNIIWRIRIPDITFSAFQQVNKVFWPVYLVADMFGVINSPVNGADLLGTFVNAAGIAIHPKAFARLKITSGSRYDAYL